MNNVDDLTKEQKLLLCSMYKDYLTFSDCLPPENANYFNDSDSITNQYFDGHNAEYVSDLCWKLKTKGYITCTLGDDLANNVRLTDKTIIYFENRFKNKLKSVVSFIASLKE